MSKITGRQPQVAIAYQHMHQGRRELITLIFRKTQNVSNDITI